MEKERAENVDKENINDIQSAIESMLFASGNPVDLDKISDVLQVEKKLIRNILEMIIDKYEKPGSGIQVVQLDDKYQMCTCSKNAEYVRRLLDVRRKMPLSSAAMEVLAIIAYNQPVTKAFVEQVRGIDSSMIVNSLAQKGLIEERGRLELPGHPIMYGTSSLFLRSFGIQSLDELPEITKEQG